jgi:hypothetical protein
MAYDIPTRFHKVWSRNLREMCLTNKSKSVGQTLLQLPWKKKRGGSKTNLDSFHQSSWNFVGISTVVCGSFGGGRGVENKFKMAAVAMITKKFHQFLFGEFLCFSIF